MRILFIGDVVGRSGRAIVSERLPKLVRDWKLDLVIVNGENAAGGFGITEAIYNDFVDAGAGMGRALLLATRRPFKQIVGIEVSPALAAIARENVERWLHTYEQARCRDVRVVLRRCR